MARTAKKEKRSTVKRGDAALNELKRNQERQEARRELSRNQGPFRFYVRKAERGGGYEEHELVVLDDDIAENAAFQYEHEVDGPGAQGFKDRKYVVCVDEVDDCALCRAAENGIDERFKFSRYGMYFTVGDLSEYEIQKGDRRGEVVDYTRKLFVAYNEQIDQILKVARLCKERHGTTRGMIIVVSKTRQMDPRSGELQMLDNGMLFDFMPEDELDAYYNDAVTRDGKVIKEEGVDIEPFDYDDFLAMPDQKVIRKMFDLPAPPGSEDEEDAETGSSGRRRRRRAVSTPDDVGGTAKGTSRSRRRSARGDADDDDADDDDVPQDTARRSRRRRSDASADDEPPARPTRRGRGRRDETDDDGYTDYDDEDGNDEDDDESPPPATSRSRRSRSEPDSGKQADTTRRRRRGAEDDNIPFE